MREMPWFVLVGVVAIVCGMITKLAQIRSEGRPRREETGRELTGEEALFGLAAAEDLRDLKGRMDRIEGRIDQIARALEALAPMRPTAARTLEPVAPETPPAEWAQTQRS